MSTLLVWKSLVNLLFISGFIRDLFLWSVFGDRSNLATCLCSRSENSIVSTLLASKIYQTAAEKTNELEKREDYKDKERIFDVHAASIINECFQTDEEFAVSILTDKSQRYFNYSPWQLAKESNSRSFLATKCVQKYLDKKWFGAVNSRKYSMFWIVILIFILSIFPFCIPIVAKYTTFLSWKKGEHEPKNASKWNIIRFYQERAIVRFFYNIIFYIAFLCLFSFVLLVDYFPINNNGGTRDGYFIIIPITEIILHFCMFVIFTEECIELRLYYNEKRLCNINWKPLKYFTIDKWNILDLIAILFYVSGFIARWFPSESAFAFSKICMCLSLFLWYVRILHFFVVSKRIGSNLLKIFYVMEDLGFFIYIILIFLIGYSVTSYSLITTNQQVIWNKNFVSGSSETYELAQNGSSYWNWTILRNVIDWGMWKIYGQVSLLNNVEVDGSTLNADNDAYGTTVFILTIIFVCIANVILLNVLIALFNDKLGDVKHNSYESWAFHRFLLVNEYSRKSPFPPPINLLHYAVNGSVYLYRKWQYAMSDNIHGSLDHDSELDSNLYDIISFNAMDPAKFTGTITEVSINFSTASTTKNPDIWLFVIERATAASKPDSFTIISRCPLFEEPKQKNTKNWRMSAPAKLESGIQTFPTNIKIRKGQYLAIRFSPGAGNPYSTGRNQYYVNTPVLPDSNHTFLFTHCPSKGVTMSFKVKKMKGSQAVTDEHMSANRMKTTSSELTISNTTEWNEFRVRDNMLRERRIAQEYWAKIIIDIKKSERDENDILNQGENF